MKPASLLHIASTDQDADMRYAVGMSIPDRIIYLKTAGRTVALVPGSELARVKEQSHVARALSLERYLRRTERKGVRKPGLAEAAAEFCQEQGVRKATVPNHFPLGLARQLRKLGVRIKVREGHFFPERQFKSAAEVKMITAALGMAEVGMSEAIHTIKRCRIGPERKILHHGVPLTSERLRAIIETAVLQAGGFPLRTIVACGAQTCDPSESGHGPLYAHTPIVISITPRSARTGYHGQISRTLVRGVASDAVRRQYLTVLKGQAIAFTLLRDGVAGSEVHGTVERYFKSEGYRTTIRSKRPTGFLQSTGHGIGLEHCESPHASAGSSSTLRSGHVLTVGPGLYYAGTGGVRMDDMALVSHGGPQVLTQFEKILEL